MRCSGVVQESPEKSKHVVMRTALESERDCIRLRALTAVRTSLRRARGRWHLWLEAVGQPYSLPVACQVESAFITAVS